MDVRTMSFVMSVLRKNGLVCEFSLCLSRACLGKMIGLIYKWHLKKTVFTHRMEHSK